MKLLNGKEVAARVKAELKTEVDALKEKNINPGLAVIIVGVGRLRSGKDIHLDTSKKLCCYHNMLMI